MFAISHIRSSTFSTFFVTGFYDDPFLSYYYSKEKEIVSMENISIEEVFSGYIKLSYHAINIFVT